MAIGRAIALAILGALTLAACDRSYSRQEVGYPGYVSASAAPAGAEITPPSSGTSNGTGTAVPMKAK